MTVPGAVVAVAQSTEPQTLADSWLVTIAPDYPTGWAPSGRFCFHVARHAGEPASIRVGDHLAVPVDPDAHVRLPNGSRLRLLGCARDANAPLP